MGSFVRDLRQALRSLALSPGYAAATVAVLALGIGANAVVFSIANGILLQPLPYAASERLGIVWHDLGQGAQSLPALNALDYRDYRERARLFEDFAVATGRERILGDPNEPTLVQAGLVAAHFFRFLGITPVLGRDFAPEEDVAGGPRVVMLSHELWKTRYGSDGGVIGRSLDLDGQPYEIVGVLPEGFRLLLPPEAFRLRDSALWVPVQIDWKRLPPRNYTGFTAFARLRLVLCAGATRRRRWRRGGGGPERSARAAPRRGGVVVPLRGAREGRPARGLGWGGGGWGVFCGGGGAMVRRGSRVVFLVT